MVTHKKMRVRPGSMLTGHLARRCPTILLSPAKGGEDAGPSKRGTTHFASNLAHRPVSTTEAINEPSVWLAARHRWTQELTARAIAAGVVTSDIACSVDVAMTKDDEGRLLH